MAGWNWVYWCAETGCLASSRELLLCWYQSCWESACCSPHRHLSAAVLLMNDMQEVQEQLYLNKGVILLLLIILSGSRLISVRSSVQQLQTNIIKCVCAHMGTHTHTNAHTHACAHTCMRAHAHTCARTHTHVHAVVEEHWHVQVTLSTHEARCSVAVLRVHCVM